MERKMKFSHPGKILKMEIIDGRGLSISKASELLGITRASLSNIVNSKSSITPNMALRIETVFGGTADFWVRLQASYDLESAKQDFYKNPPKIRYFEYS
ncbi:MAG TPA: addiction module antidote protein, HigA family [Porphyromonadaceae bacterium]|jgi:addiction module HigA family antidote|uniref:HigA family addiction module antitoxin n=1 Tax=Limibacterium fermenti TaxID=3229863 RepID=UPI000E85AFFB|nr:addiction module antidote protein, HigA family [Porphyromonadaceae bacterium]HBL34073.1 addiction module antidote protein, HigA family [Porphyromonadaceae bacterium]HBX21457.1 addiction module antidote protein, HigA family [Porphyromonadaceae bacterium]HBX44911.1 addiction module antidote protein, HigA family [Porphyromonadaceae bacterium]HCM19499.1 addiction module antidote protein, HigA family [Porphyromonadaceae bacterium]